MELIHNVNWPTVSDIIRSETATTMYKSLNGLVPEYLSNLFVKNSTRNDRELRITETDLSLQLRPNALDFSLDNARQKSSYVERCRAKGGQTLSTFHSSLPRLRGSVDFVF